MSVRVGIGISTFPFAEAKAFWRWVDLCEAGPLDSMWQTDRLHSSQPFLEALSTMASIAGATERIKFGFNAVVVTTRDPLVLAKQCATVDYLSGGRLLPVFGVGSDRAPEWKATGRETKGRGKRADEAIAIMRRLWSEDAVDFHGEYYQYAGASIRPRPIQNPLPCWIGGSSAAAVRRTARLGTGWLGGIQTPEQVAPVIAAIKAKTKELGTHIDDDHYGQGFPFRFGSADDALVARMVQARSAAAPKGFDPSYYTVVGDAAAVIERCREYRAAGVSKFVLIPLASGDDDLIDQTKRLVDEVLPVVHGWD